MTNESWNILIGDCRERLAALPDESVHMIWTSPPYFGLRDYDAEGQIGQEPTPQDFEDALVAVFKEARRVLRKDGTLWLNLGDAYSRSGKGVLITGEVLAGDKQKSNQGSVSIKAGMKHTEHYKPKDLMGIPWRVAFALQKDGWYLRQDIIWSKGFSMQESFGERVADAALKNGVDPEVIQKIMVDLDLYVGNPMPESVRDRCSSAHEHVFLFAKNKKYFYDHIAVKEVVKHPEATGTYGTKHVHAANNQYSHSGREYSAPQGRNLRNVWAIPTKGYKGAHFATCPEALVEPCIKAGTSEHGCCASCGAPYKRDTRKVTDGSIANKGTEENLQGGRKGDNPADYDRLKIKGAGGIVPQEHEMLGWVRTCACETEDIVPCTVLDPFMGAATTLLVADKLGRSSIGIELNPEYAKIAESRLEESRRERYAPWQEEYVTPDKEDAPVEALSFEDLIG